ncbi:acyl-CoA dehydrogenase [Antarcticibacterium flavum]|uniref:Acyl-CoA dehydrogenase n=1 Tax=Antarcticibacterium flavum TaxID=2058175 RepID=A0A5B7X0R0_9FLAO|nr:MULTISPECIES: acyl-CoA dehydrogenase family protein [Antarcticibacterium]MCM4159824.1 acyl-CoA dehydrogenase [Antarcticibacterium sp. W02-3]QCY68830.1 acyl-CoA dehydrogenase [Antarcticibacterium flavum]
MKTIQKNQEQRTGGAFLVRTAGTGNHLPAQFSEEEKMILGSVKEFIQREVQPHAEEMEHQKEHSRSVALLEKAGELGLLGLGIAEEFGGLPVSFTTILRVTEEVGRVSEFSPTFGVQTSIGIAPILFYGKHAQKQKYLPKLVSGEWKSCYCLTEPDAGSDANSGKTRATPVEEGAAYVLNGQKMWITNSGFADVFIVFAKVEDDRNLSAFIVEKEFGGISLGEEERKMGIKGSSTRQVFFNNVRVPLENMLGEREEGFKIALNVLNGGRIKLGAGAIGTSKTAFDLAVAYAKERKQFGTSISNFGAIQHKLAQMAVRIFALEAATYLTGKYIDDKINALEAGGLSAEKAEVAAVSAYGIECAVIKVYGSESLALVVDEGVQIFGGMGFSEDAPMARLYRNARITRIYEGTNEINRMLIVDMLLKKANTGELKLLERGRKIKADLTTGETDSEKPARGPKESLVILQELKNANLLILEAATQKLGKKLKEEQEVLMHVSDMVMQVYLLEAVITKIANLKSEGQDSAPHKNKDIANVFIYESVEKIRQAGQEAIFGFADGEERSQLLSWLESLTMPVQFNIKDARRKIAQMMIEEGKYV